MDFKTVLTTVIRRFTENHIQYGLMGGFALGLWGVSRATVDIDFLIDKRHMEQTNEIMRALGYEIAFRSENVSQFRSPLKTFGEIDFIHAYREASMDMLKRAVEKELYGGEVKIRVLVPEDIIGLKLQAIKNNPARKELDLGDIKALASMPDRTLDWNAINRYADLFDVRTMIDEIRNGN